MLALVVGFGLVGLEEEDEEAAVAFDGTLEGLQLEVLDELVGGLAPVLGELGVLVAPAVEGATGNAGGFCGTGDRRA